MALLYKVNTYPYTYGGHFSIGKFVEYNKATIDSNIIYTCDEYIIVQEEYRKYSTKFLFIQIIRLLTLQK